MSNKSWTAQIHVENCLHNVFLHDMELPTALEAAFGKAYGKIRRITLCEKKQPDIKPSTITDALTGEVVQRGN